MSEQQNDAVEKIAPVQGYSAGIPWAMHLRAYDAYCKKFRPQDALIQGWCRGGFSTEELDMFIPGWREELSELKRLKDELTALRTQVADLKSWKESALAVEAQWNLQEIAKLLGMTLGLDIRANLKPAILKLLAREEAAIKAHGVVWNAVRRAAAAFRWLGIPGSVHKLLEEDANRIFEAEKLTPAWSTDWVIISRIEHDEQKARADRKRRDDSEWWI